MVTNIKLTHPFSLVKVDVLPSHVIAKIAEKYQRGEGRAAVEALAQGDIDILESCRQALGWKTITSLAHKYYPLYPERYCWKRALATCMRYRDRWYTKTLSIRYLLKAVVQQFYQGLIHNFSGKLSDILNSTSFTLKKSMDTILNSKGVWGKTHNPPRDDPGKYIRGRYSHMVLR